MKNKKILYCASTISHLQNFHLPYLQGLQEIGYSVTVCAEQACRFPYVDEMRVIPFQKQLIGIENLKNIFRVYQLLKQENYAALSVHTTLAGAVVRAAVLLLPKRKRPKVFYTCHGYLFGELDGISKWKYLLPEKICASVTDVLMVMNTEDKAIAKHHKLYNQKHGKLVSIPGMGVDFSKFDIAETKAELRQRYGIAENEILYIFAGEFSERKNQKLLIQAFATVAERMPNAKLILAGEGVLLDDCRQQVKELNLQNQILFPGYVANISILYHVCDICVSASKIEGLPFNIMEAMYCQLPCIVSDIKGHRELITRGCNGYRYSNVTEFVEYLLRCYQSVHLRQRLGMQAKEDVMQYGLVYVKHMMINVYEENL